MGRLLVVLVSVFSIVCCSFERGLVFVPDGLNRFMIRHYVYETGYYSELYPPEYTCVAPDRPLCFCDGSEPQAVVAGLRPEERVDLNTATLERLEELPGVGWHTATEIGACRPFEAVDDLLEVRGIGPGKMRLLLPLVRVGSP